ncbi:hypothetical protein Tco_0668372 [Tanacetum coccineum]
MDEAIQAGTIRILKGSFVLCVGEPPEKIVTCGSHPLESSFQNVLRRGYVSTEFYEYKRSGKYEVTVTIQKVSTAYACRMVETVISHPLTQFVIEGENNLWCGNHISSYSKKRVDDFCFVSLKVGLKENCDMAGLGECAGKELCSLTIFSMKNMVGGVVTHIHGKSNNRSYGIFFVDSAMILLKTECETMTSIVAVTYNKTIIPAASGTIGGNLEIGPNKKTLKL